MSKLVMERKPSDNKYLHKDFHGAMSNGLQYLHEKYGEDSVRDYLKRFTKTFYASLIDDFKIRGLIALKEYFQKVYEIEGGRADIRLEDDQLTIIVYECPAVTHLRKKNMPVSKLFYETSKCVNEALCEETDYSSELINYNEETGACIQRFYRRV